MRKVQRNTLHESRCERKSTYSLFENIIWIRKKDQFPEWITYYTDESTVGIDFAMEVTEPQPLVVLR